MSAGLSTARSEDVRINEVLAANRLAAFDEEGNSPDWFELVNTGSEEVDLEGYTSSDDGLVPDKWVFPSVTLPPGGFLLVWCSGNDRVVPGNGVDPPLLHTSFRLDDGGGLVTLRASDGRHLGDAVYPEQSPDQSWARSPDGNGGFMFHLEPTPGAPNRGPTSVSSLVVADTTFTVDRGFFDEPFDVILRSATPQATIRYTVDGTVPTLENGETYRFPVRIDRTTVLRAAAYRDGYRPSNVDTQTYIFLDDVVTQDAEAVVEAGFPERWGGVTADYGFDPRVIGENDEFGGKYRESIRDDLRAVPTMSIVLPVEDVFGPGGIYTNSHLTGPTAERAASVELIYPNGDEGFQEDCGLRIHGGAFREHTRTKKHSFRLLFKRIYGSPKLRYPLFGLEAAGEFDTVVLRANANDGYPSSDAGPRPLYLRDSYARETQLAVGAASSRGRFVHLYINGIYWGLYNPSERPDASFSASYFGGAKEEWDAIASGFEPQEGDLAAWDEFLRVTASGFASLDAYMAAQGLHVDGTPNPALEVYLDVENVIDYMIANLYVGNISTAGIMVRTTRVFPPGTILALHLKFPEAAFTLGAVVMWARQGNVEWLQTGRVGMGLMFVDPPPELIALLRERGAPSPPHQG